MKKTIFSLSAILVVLGFFSLNIGLYLELEGQIARIHSLQHDEFRRADRMAEAVESLVVGNATTLISMIQEDPAYSDVMEADGLSERDRLVNAIETMADMTIDSLSVDYQETFTGERL